MHCLPKKNKTKFWYEIGITGHGLTRCHLGRYDNSNLYSGYAKSWWEFEILHMIFNFHPNPKKWTVCTGTHLRIPMRCTTKYCCGCEGIVLFTFSWEKVDQAHWTQGSNSEVRVRKKKCRRTLSLPWEHQCQELRNLPLHDLVGPRPGDPHGLSIGS